MPLTRVKVALIALSIAVILLLFFLLNTKPKSEPIVAQAIAATQITIPDTPITPLHTIDNLKPALIQLGQQLFHDPRLSRDNSISCGSCHILNKGGVDGLPKPVGIRGQVADINTLSVYNAAFNVRQTWTGKVKTLEDQITIPITDPRELDSSWELVLSKLKQDPSYSRQFNALFSDGITSTNVSHAIATFERTLITLDSPFDRWLQGDAHAISEQAVRGYESFQRYGCIACHQGSNVGGNMFERMGVVNDYFADRGNITTVDYGLFNLTQKEKDRFVFRVASLRNIALTAPYFHDGSTKTLEQAVSVMAHYQLGLTLDDKSITDIVAFLESLTGKIPATARVDAP